MINEVQHVIASDLLTEQLDDELVVLDLKSGFYYGLTAVATRIWKLLQEGKTLPQTREMLLNEYDVTPAQLTADIDSLLGSLASQGLILPLKP